MVQTEQPINPRLAAGGAAVTRALPIVQPMKTGKLPAVVDTTLANGLRVIATRKPGLPMVQARLRIDVSKSKNWDNGVLADLVDGTLLAGTTSRSQVAIAEELQRIGAVMSTSADVEDFYVVGTAIATELRHYLDLLCDVLVNATFPQEEVTLTQQRLMQSLTLMRSQPPAIAAYALAERVFPGHVYGRGMPTEEMVAALTRADVRKYHRSVVSPAAAMLVLVGDMPPAKMVAIANDALAGWTGKHTAGKTPVPAELVPGPAQVVNYPGAVQSNIRIGGIGIGRTHPDFAALSLALTVLGGGGLTSRLNTNLREDKGYTYGAYTNQNHNLAASQIVGTADVQNDVTAPALVEFFYELGRLATTLPGEDELVSAKRFIQGTLALSVDTQAGLATYLTLLAVSGLDISYLREYPAALEAVTAEQVLDAAAKYLAPARLATVIVGDAEHVTPSVERILPVEVIG